MPWAGPASSARGEQRVDDGTATLAERSTTRQLAIHGMEDFTRTGLLAVALPDLDMAAPPWTIEAALSVARRTEHGLQDVSAEDADWTRLQNQIPRDYTELLTALTALEHQAQADSTDFAMVITIIYQNRPERPDLIEQRITEKIIYRRELLTAREAGRCRARPLHGAGA